MIYKEKRIVLKNGTDCILRSPRPEDADSIISNWKLTSEETGFIARYPEEITMSIEAEEKFLADQQTDPKSIMIAAVIDGKIIANAGITYVQNNIKFLHRAVFGISIQKEYWNIGIGSSILSELIMWAEKAGFKLREIRTLPLDVFYISSLSEKYKKPSLSFIKGMIRAKFYAFHSLFNKERSSSIIYILRKL